MLRRSAVACTIAVTLMLAAAASAQWNEQVLYSFQGGTDGEWPLGRVVFDSAGNLYGATQAGGSSACWGWCGTVYQLAAPAQPGGSWTESVLHVFQGHPTEDGSWPLGGLLIDDAGNLYGSTGYGGTGNCEVLGTFPGCGTVYELSPPAQQGGTWTETVLYSFQGGNDGFVPYGDLAFDNEGNLYGATLYGGGHGENCGDAYYQYCGSIYELSPPKQEGGPWTEQVLYSFNGIPRGTLIGDGANPNGGLVLDSTGAIYGTTQIGGFDPYPHPGWGTVFELTPPTTHGQQWTEIVLYRFLYGADGGAPAGGLISDANGNLYGVTERGGENPQEYGTVFELARLPDAQWRHYILYSFSGANDGGTPESSVVFDKEGNLYGDATGGGTGRGGTLWELRPTGPHSWSFEVLYGFEGDPDGAFPYSPLLFDQTGNIYGTTNYGGIGTDCSYGGCGTVFEVWP